MKKISQKLAAKILGVTPQYFSQLIRGKTTPKRDRAERLAGIMGIDPWELVKDAAKQARAYLDRLNS